MTKITTPPPAIPVATLGTPRIGPRRELKAALESYWAGKTGEAELLDVSAALRAANWARQKARGVTVIPSNDFSLYDQVLDTSVMVGAIPEVYGWRGGKVPLSVYFAMARGADGAASEASCGHSHHGAGNAGQGAPAQEMTKWFDTNYHYMVPEFAPNQTFQLASLKAVDEYREAKALGYETRPVLLGPVTFLKLGKSKEAGFDPLSLLGNILPVYVDDRARLPGRLEQRQADGVRVVFDGAHVPFNLSAVLRDLHGTQEFLGPCAALVSLARDKDAEGFLGILAAQNIHAVFVDLPSSGRARPASDLEDIARRLGLSHEYVPGLVSAWRHGVGLSRARRGWLFVTGSLALVGALRGFSQPASLNSASRAAEHNSGSVLCSSERSNG